MASWRPPPHFWPQVAHAMHIDSHLWLFLKWSLQLGRIPANESTNCGPRNAMPRLRSSSDSWFFIRSTFCTSKTCIRRSEGFSLQVSTRRRSLPQRRQCGWRSGADVSPNVVQGCGIFWHRPSRTCKPLKGSVSPGYIERGTTKSCRQAFQHTYIYIYIYHIYIYHIYIYTYI